MIFYYVYFATISITEQFYSRMRDLHWVTPAFQYFHSTLLRYLWQEYVSPIGRNALNQAVFVRTRELWSGLAARATDATTPTERAFVDALFEERVSRFANWDLVGESDYERLRKANSLSAFLFFVRELISRSTDSRSRDEIDMQGRKVLHSEWEQWNARVSPLSHELISSVKSISGEYLIWLAKHEAALNKVAWEAFERIIAEIFASHGFEVQLTGHVKGRSADLIALRKDEFGVETKYLVEVKRYRKKKVGIDIVNSVVGAAARERAHHAFLVTTSSFTPDVLRRRIQWKELNLYLRDGRAVLEWLKAYKPRPEGGIWLPDAGGL